MGEGISAGLVVRQRIIPDRHLEIAGSKDRCSAGRARRRPLARRQANRRDRRVARTARGFNRAEPCSPPRSRGRACRGRLTDGTWDLGTMEARRSSGGPPGPRRAIEIQAIEVVDASVCARPAHGRAENVPTEFTSLTRCCRCLCAVSGPDVRPRVVDGTGPPICR